MTITPSLDAPIRTAVDADRAEIGRTLSSAFHDDPIFAWCYPDAQWRRQNLPELFGTFADVFTPHGTTFVTEAGIAMWSPAGVEPVGSDQIEAFQARLVELSDPYAERLGDLMTIIDGAHPHDPCAYLQFIGVRAERQGRGIGSAVMTPMLDECDRTGTPGFLVATSPLNRKLYERRGFGVIEELRTSDAPPMWAMWREPAAR